MTFDTFDAVLLPFSVNCALQEKAAIHGVVNKRNIVGGVTRSVCVDDYLGSFGDEDMAKERVVELMGIIKDGDFHLRRWIFSGLRVSQINLARKRTVKTRRLNVFPKPIERTLGVQCEAGTDEYVSH